ncbi:DUF2267 domain-containing protein [Pyruvatibacter sp. HU-CL02332]|uniref:DUF2267 domain-containing protein n=1 Tax=Pyruvatibacter sp. HU-CL02332 TaxID=3127650 RepID=UPI00296A0478|nr:DUF2267 domain-containing protein [Alphaproteobacteria bacterium]
MTTAGLKVFDETVHLTNTWLNELQRDLDLESKQQAYHILRVVLHHLRDMLPVNNAIHLSAQLPMLVRGFYLENWRPGAKTPHPKTREAFLDAVSEDFMPGPDISAASAVNAVFFLLSQHVTEGEIRQVIDCLPKPVQTLWDSARPAG